MQIILCKPFNTGFVILPILSCLRLAGELIIARTKVLLIGATAHYATADLTKGPFLEQDTTRIATKWMISQAVVSRKNVLVHAVKAHLEDRITPQQQVYGSCDQN
jgi:hypothetical protein